MNLLYNSRILCASRSSDAGSTVNNSHVVDMSGFDSVMFIAKTGCEWNSTANSIKIYGSTVATTAGTNLLSNTTVAGAIAASSHTKKLFIQDVHRPALQQRYCWAQLQSAATERNDWISIQYNPTFRGSTDLYDSTTIAKAVLIAADTT